MAPVGIKGLSLELGLGTKPCQKLWQKVLLIVTNEKQWHVLNAV